MYLDNININCIKPVLCNQYGCMEYVSIYGMYVCMYVCMVACVVYIICIDG